MRRTLGLPALFLAVLLCSCAARERAYLITDVATAQTFGGLDPLLAIVSGSAEARGLELRVRVGGDEASVAEAMNAAVVDPLSRLVIAFASIPVDTRQYALGNPGVLFAGYGERGGESPSNLLLLSSERSGAFREAGERLGGIIERAGESAPASVGMLGVSPTEVAQREMAAFRAGLAETSPGSSVYYRESRSPSDRAAALRALRDLRADGSRYFLLKSYALTSACLEELETEGGDAIVEDCGSPEACGKTVLLSVETDWGATFASIFAALGSDLGAWTTAEIAEAGRVAGRGDSGPP